MKKLLFSIAIVVFLGTGCNNNTSNKEQDAAGTHAHEDGTIHNDHENEEHHQEEFKAQSDSTIDSVHNHEHSHDGDHSHSH